jgi:hypothetical protein
MEQRSENITIASKKFIKEILTFFIDKFKGSKIGPGTYNIKSSIDDLIHKRVSEKGPYQVFTTSRSAPISTGHYAVLDTWDLSPDFPSKDYPESISLTHELKKNKHGTFSKLDRFQKKPTDRLAIEHPGKYFHKIIT